jgi:hypothetical protein
MLKVSKTELDGLREALRKAEFSNELGRDPSPWGINPPA